MSETTTETKKPKIYAFINGIVPGLGDVLPVALAEDGTPLASHCSSSIHWARHDIGVTSDWKHEIYEKHYPNGFDVEWIDEPDQHEGCRRALEIANENRAKAPDTSCPEPKETNG
jgi:hypothetical protein